MFLISRFIEFHKTVFEGVTTASSISMAAAAVVHTAYTAGAQHHEVHPSSPEYQKIKLELENAGLVLNRLIKLTNTVLAEMFQTEVAYLVRVRPQGMHIF